MSGNVFVDTNVFVYARDLTDPDRQQRAEEWLKHLWRDGTGRTGVQVLNEYFVTVTRKLEPGFPREEAWADVQDLLAWEPRALDRTVMELAGYLSERYTFRWWDALVVAAARLEECSILLTEDLQDGLMTGDQKTGELRVMSPFLHPPGGVTIDRAAL